MEAAVSWEAAAKSDSGLPAPIYRLFDKTIYKEPTLLIAGAEHRVSLAGRGGKSQCDVFALLNSAVGLISVAIEAKAREKFGSCNEALEDWLLAKGKRASKENRADRWAQVCNYLPTTHAKGYSRVAFQLLHRCATAVIEAERYGVKHAAFVVQAFGSPDSSYQEFCKLGCAMGLECERGKMVITSIRDIALGIGWADCPVATDRQFAFYCGDSTKSNS